MDWQADVLPTSLQRGSNEDIRKSYLNDYGLYNMSGNVSEWTNSSFNNSSYYMSSTMNSNVEDRNNKRKTKVTRKGPP